MQHELLIAILAGLGGMLGWGLADFFAKKTIDKIGDVTTLFWSQFIGIFPLLALFLLKPSIPSLSGPSWAYLTLLGAWSGLSYIPTYIAFGKGKVSLLSPIFASYAVVVTLLSAAFFGEIIPFGRQIAFLIVFIGIVLINGGASIFNSLMGKEKMLQGKVEGLKEILCAICFYSVWLIALDRFINGSYWVPFLLVIRIFSTLALLAYAAWKKKKLLFADKGLWKFLLLVGTFDVAAFGFVAYGFSATRFTSVVAMLSAAFSIPTIILARIFLKERTTTAQTIGSIIVILGVMLLFLI